MTRRRARNERILKAHAPSVPMQLPTHFLSGMTLQLFILRVCVHCPGILTFTLIAFAALLAHVFLDCIAISTYHPPQAHLDDKFWKGFHILVYLAALVLLLVWGSTLWWGMLWSAMIDLVDWILLRAILKRPPIVHPIIDKIRNLFFGWLPNLTERKWAVVGELVINAGFLGLCLGLLL